MLHPPFGNSSNEPQSLEAALPEATAPTPRPEGKYTFDGLVGRPGSGEYPGSRIRQMKVISLTGLECSACKQIASVLALVEDDVAQLFGDAG